jgi:hypothetical protein
LKEAGLIVFGAVLGWAVNYFMPLVTRRAQGRTGVLVHLETDSAIFESGEPPWIGYSFVFPHGISELGPPPPGNCPEWWAWARANQGVDAEKTKVRLTIIGDSETTVIIEALRIAVVRRTEPVDGALVVCPVGGADLTPRHIAVELDSFAEAVTTYYDAGGDPTGRFSFALARGEAEVFNIEAAAGRSYTEWVGELYLLVDRRRQIVHISDQGEPFRTTASSHLEPLTWTGDKWDLLRSEGLFE